MKLGVIGCGKMGTALVAGAVRSGTIKAADVAGMDPHREARESFTKHTGAEAHDGIGALEGCDVFLLCTKPQDVAGALKSVMEVSGESVLVISIAAGVTLTTLETAAGHATRVIRAMPNTPALVGKGAAAYCLGAKATSSDAEIAKKLLGSVGLAIEVKESLMDAVTGLSGSGPAYVYQVIEALADGGVRVGLARADALQLAAQTVFGAAAMVLETGDHPAVLKDMVTSPGGTTIAGLAELEARGLRSALIEAVAAATRRSRELGG
ncbi:MAG: pyrroline-5-carboxylate reductase [Verrucomicrobiota bacterium]